MNKKLFLLILLSIIYSLNVMAANHKIEQLLSEQNGKRGIAEMTKLLEGGEVDAKDFEGRTAIMWAARYGYVELVKALIEAGANIDIGDVDGNTPLMRASYNGHVNVVRILINAGVDISTKDNDGNTALMLASKYKRTNVVNILNNALENNSSSKSLYQLVAARRGQSGIKEIQLLLMTGDINAGLYDDEYTLGDDYYCQSALMIAAGHGYTEIVKKLIEEKANVNAVHWAMEFAGFTALAEATSGGYIEIVRMLINAGANVSGEPGDMALLTAIYRSDVAIVKLLIDNGVDVNTCSDGEGASALVYAKREGNRQIINMLVAAGAVEYGDD